MYKILTVLMAITSLLAQTQNPVAQDTGPVLVIHGGAGTITRSQMTPEREQLFRQTLEEALRAGYDILQDGGTSLDAVVAAVRLMEDSPLFNAGYGAVLTSEGTVELDASIMDGIGRTAGSVAGLRHIRNPIDLARIVMERSAHVMMIGEGAEQFAAEHQVPTVTNDHFITEHRRQQLIQAQQREREVLDGPEESDSRRESSPGYDAEPLEKRFGTVGAVALDMQGNLAAATSSGGMTNKRFGRVGDVPIIGAGTYADNETLAVSATGHGEFFIRGVVSHDIASMMRYGGMSLEDASRRAIEKLGAMGGTGGVVALDRRGNIAMPFNTEGMYRGFIDQKGRVYVAIYGDEDQGRGVDDRERRQ
jgi:L-asparaginase / beta-aspartyl-peptidase